MSTPTALATDDTEPPTLFDTAPGLTVVAMMLAVMWGAELVDLLPGVSLDRWGIRPRSARGLAGIVFAPFLHTGFAHLIANSIPFALLGGVVALGGVQRFAEATLAIGVVSGLGVWLFGASDTVHLGASGLVFGYITYLVSRGVFAARFWWIVGGLIVAVAYGGTVVWGVLPSGRMSWQGHLFGAIGGVVAAWLLHADHGDDEDHTASPSRPRPM